MLKNFRLFIPFFIATTFIKGCFSAEPSHLNNNILSNHLSDDISPLKPLIGLFTQAMNEPVLYRKVDLFCELEKSFDSTMRALTPPPSQDIQDIIKSTHAQGQLEYALALMEVVRNMNVGNSIISKKYEHWNKAVELLRQCSASFNDLKQNEEYQRSQSALGSVLGGIGTLKAIQADSESVPQAALTYLIEGIQSLKSALIAYKSDDTKESLKMAYEIAIRKSLDNYVGITLQFQEILLQQKVTPDFHQNIKSAPTLMVKILKIIELYLEDFPEDKVRIELNDNALSKPSTSKKQRRPLKTFEKPIEVIDLEDLLRCVATTYCSILQTSANLTANSVHLTLAKGLYIKYLYKGSYNEDLKERFVTASLEYLSGNNKPLNEFYRYKRELYIANQIKQEQAKRREQQEQAQRAQIEQQKAIKASTKEAPQPLASSDDEKIVLLSPLSPGTPPQASQEKTQSDAQNPNSVPSLTPSGSNNRPEASKKKTQGGTQTPPPVMSLAPSGSNTRPQASKQKTQGTAQNPTPVPSLIPSAPQVSAPVKIILQKNDFTIFSGLIGQTKYRNFTVKAVKTLLKNLNAKVDPTQGKGVHQKVTAPNGQIWIAPKEWNGPIPDYYRLQLNHFIQEELGIDPDNVSQK